MATARWKEKPTGFATVKVGKWWQRPGEPSAPIPGTTSAAPRAGGGTFSDRSRTATRNSLVPREWVGSEGLIGNWAKPPRLDPTQFETMKSSETGRWWARPITDTTGMSPQQVASVRSYDAQTAAGQSQVSKAFADYMAQANQSSQAGTQQLTGLANLVGSGYSGDPTGAVLSEAARKSTGASLAPAVADLARLPTVGAEAGASAVSAYTANRQSGRTDMISGINQAAAASNEKALDRNVTLRGQELDALGQAAGLKSDQQIAQLRADTDAADRQARIDMNTQDNETQLTATQLRVTAAEKAAAKKAGRKPPTANDIRQWAKVARTMWDGVPHKVQQASDAQTDAGRAFFADPKNAGKSYTEFYYPPPEEVYRELIAQGATKQRAIRIVRNVTGQVNFMSKAAGRATTTFPSITGNW